MINNCIFNIFLKSIHLSDSWKLKINKQWQVTLRGGGRQRIDPVLNLLVEHFTVEFA